MKRTLCFVMALALVLGLAQCKKEQPLEPTNEGNVVNITLNVDSGASTGSATNGSKAEVVPPHVNFVEGDTILVASDGKYVGYLVHDGTTFSGGITNPTEGQPLYFYFLGNKIKVSTLAAGTTNECTVNISDQTGYPALPVISMAPSEETYPSNENVYTASLHNKCSLMKFNVTTPSSSAICITGMNNTVSVNFATVDDEHDNGFSYAMNGIGEIKMKGQAGAGEKTYWAIVLPQASVAIGNAYTADRAYIGTRPAIEGGIGTDQFLNAGFSMTVNTELSSSTPLTLEALTDGTIKVNSPKTGMQYTLNDGDKSPVTTADIQVSAGDKVQFYGNGTSITNYSGTKIYGGTADVKAYGNIMSLIDEENYATATTLTNNQAFRLFFQNNVKLTDASSLLLPATTLSTQCYQYMFSGCKSLTAAPALPAMTMVQECYQYMFKGCTSLTTAPALPATKLDRVCYANMFNGCSSLTAAPAQLPALTLAQQCYQYMFDGCTSLTTAPALPAETLANYCYQYMFNGCSKLTTAPALPATGMKTACYSYMFYGCTSLTTAPTLPATTLASGCYANMFNGCSNLSSITCLATSIGTGTTSNWVNGVAGTGTFTKASGVNWTTGVNGIPEDWEVEVAQ